MITKVRKEKIKINFTKVNSYVTLNCFFKKCSFYFSKKGGVKILTDNLKNVFLSILEAEKTEIESGEDNFSQKSNNLILFFPELENVIEKSIKNGSLDHEILKKELENLFLKKFHEKENFRYFFEVVQYLKIPEGKQYLRNIFIRSKKKSINSTK